VINREGKVETIMRTLEGDKMCRKVDVSVVSMAHTKVDQGNFVVIVDRLGEDGGFGVLLIWSSLL